MHLLPHLGPLAAATALLLAACTSSSPDSSGRDIGSPRSGPTDRPASAATRPAARPYSYLALGDSVAVGTGAQDPNTGGYVPLLAALLRDRAGCDDERDCPLVTRNLATSGATTATVLQQTLPSLRTLLRSTPAPPPVRLVTLTVGGNDVFGPVLLSCALEPTSAACATAAGAAVATAGRGVDAVLDQLDTAVPDAVVAVTAYYDPLPSCRLAALSPLAVQVLEGDGTRDGLNDVLRAVAARHGAVVVETATLLTERADLVGGDDCLHPSGQGHRKIARAFDAAVGARVTGG